MTVPRPLLLAAGLPLLVFVPIRAKTPPTVAVAMYADKGAFGNGPGLLEDEFGRTRDLRVTKVTAADVRAGKLKDFRVLIIPGGVGGTQGKALGAEGRAAVRAFVEDGGTFVGVCAGCYLASTGYDWSLDLLPVWVVDRNNWQRGRGTLPLELTAAGKEWFGRTDDRVKVLYCNGPVLEPLDDAAAQKLIVLAHYRGELVRPGARPGLMLGSPAVVAARFGKGWAVGISPHPEQTEGLRDLVPSAVRWALAHPAK
jgi:putative intracellular protease/amidase